MDFVDIAEKNNCVYITLNRPEKRNAFHPQMIDELTQAFKKANSSKARAVILSGNGKSFCAGADLEWMQSMVDYTMEENVEDSEKLFEMFFAATECEVPVITYVHGHVMGGALGLVAISDIVIAEQGTKFSFSEVRLGLAPAVISPFVLRKMNPTHAHQVMLTGERFSSEYAKLSGLVHQIVNDGDQEEVMQGFINEFLQNGPEAVRATKNLLTAPMIHDLYKQKDFVSKTIAERRVGAEGQEGLKGFINNQEISWKIKVDNA